MRELHDEHLLPIRILECACWLCTSSMHIGYAYTTCKSNMHVDALKPQANIAYSLRVFPVFAIKSVRCERSETSGKLPLVIFDRLHDDRAQIITRESHECGPEP